MSGSKRDQVLKTAWRLFESQGYHATGINQIISESGVPKGSFYHYFPEGKEGLAVEAIDAIGEGLRTRVRTICSSSQDAIEAVGCLFRHIARHLVESDFQHGGPLTIVALETATTNDRLNQACRRAYGNVLDELSQQLSDDGFRATDARELGALVLAGLEGGILLSRTLHSAEPMEQIARQLDRAIRSRQLVSREGGAQ